MADGSKGGGEDPGREFAQALRQLDEEASDEDARVQDSATRMVRPDLSGLNHVSPSSDEYDLPDVLSGSGDLDDLDALDAIADLSIDEADLDEVTALAGVELRAALLGRSIGAKQTRDLDGSGPGPGAGPGPGPAAPRRGTPLSRPADPLLGVADLEEKEPTLDRPTRVVMAQELIAQGAQPDPDDVYPDDVFDVALDVPDLSDGDELAGEIATETHQRAPIGAGAAAQGGGDTEPRGEGEEREASTSAPDAAELRASPATSSDEDAATSASDAEDSSAAGVGAQTARRGNLVAVALVMLGIAAGVVALVIGASPAARVAGVAVGAGLICLGIYVARTA